MKVHSVIWVVALTLFLGGVGFPIPENPILLGGGYAIFKAISPPLPSLCLWYLAILGGDAVLFSIAYWFFTRPPVASRVMRCVGEGRLKKYQTAFAYHGGWTLFLARFTFGLRAVAYIAAGAAHYPWPRFLAVDGLSVAIQVLLFVGIGYYAGEEIEWAKASSEKIALVLGLLAFVTVLITWVAMRLSSTTLQKPSKRNSKRPKSDALKACSGTAPDARKKAASE